MKSSLSFLLSVALCLLIGEQAVYSESSDDIRFKRISIEQGLSQSTVFSITQDKAGNMWFATFDGVNRFDGYDFSVYQHRREDPSSIAEDICNALCTDPDGDVWIGTAAGLSLYDRAMDCFRNYVYDGNLVSVNGIAPLSGNRLLVAMSAGMSVFDKEKEDFSDESLPAELLDIRASSLSSFNGSLCIGTEDGRILIYDPEKNEVKSLPFFNAGVRVQTMLYDGERFLWAGTEGNGLYRLEPASGQAIHFTYENSALTSDFVRALAKDTSNRLWIGTFNSLCIYDQWREEFSVHSSSPFNEESISQNSVRSLFRDNQGGMWAGTFFGGLNYYHPLKLRFRNLRQESNESGLRGKVVSCIVEDSDRTLWIGTNDGGVNHYDPSTGKSSYYLQNGKDNGVETNDIKTIYIDKDRQLVFIGAHIGGMNILDRRTGAMMHCTQKGADRGMADVYSIIRRDAGSLWVGTLDGLYIFDVPARRFIPAEADPLVSGLLPVSIRSMFQDSSRRLWIGSTTGLQVYDVSEGRIGACLSDAMPLKGISSVYDFHESRNGAIWIGSRSGLYCYDKGVLKHYTTEEGLPNNVIYGIEEDSQSRLWLSSNKGISCYDPSSGIISNYSAKDGLQSDQFNPYSHCRTVSGRMYFGGINGITTFIPEQLKPVPYSPAPVITQLSVLNKIVRPGDGTGILDGNISDTESITLNHGQRSFSISFVVSNFISGQHNSFRCRLAGFDDDWYFPKKGIRSVSYSNLPAGRYVFMVQSANSDGVWSKGLSSLEIVVKPAWYSTWWAISLYIVVSGLVIFFISHFLWERKVMSANLEMERKEKEAREEINQMKMRFFINISHELRTPLTLIVAPLQEMISKSSDRWMRSQLKFIERNTNRILHLVNQLMDYRRAELGVFRLKVSREDAYALVNENFSYYEKLAHHKGLEYSFISDLEDKKFILDKKYMDLIVNNLISNAFKYTEKGSITVRLFEEKGCLVFVTEDTGKGIPIDKQSKIFERFYQADKEHIGSGIGLSLVQRLAELHHGRVEMESTEGKGSRFSVYFPQQESLYSQEEIMDSTDEACDDLIYTTSPKEMYYIDTETEEEEWTGSDARKKGKILVVEDNDEIRKYLVRGLSSSFDLLSAGDGQEASDLLKENPDVDLVITDLMMPVMDGIRLCRNIKQNICTSHIPVIMLSAKADVEDQLEAYQIGADDFIPKPFSLQLLAVKVHNIIKTRKRMFERYSRSMEVEPENITFSQMDEDMLRKAIDVVKKNMDNEAFSTEEFAREMNMSRSNLHLKMKAITGESALDFVRKIRFNEACNLLKEGRYTIAEISYRVGFSSPSYFSTSFKKYVGCLPTEYLKRNGQA